MEKARVQPLMNVIATETQEEQFAWNVGKPRNKISKTCYFSVCSCDFPYSYGIKFSIRRKPARKSSDEESDIWVYTIKTSHPKNELCITPMDYELERYPAGVRRLHMSDDDGQYWGIDERNLKQHMRDQHGVDHLYYRQFLMARNGQETQVECGDFVDGCTYSFREDANLLETDCLEFRFVLTLIRLSERRQRIEKILHHPDDLARNFTELFESGDFSDLTIESNGKSHPAHKAVLAARSPVFKTMFRTGMKETRENLVKIETKGPDTMERFLQFIYSGQFEGFDESKMGLTDLKLELFGLATQYDIPRLRFICELDLLKSLSVDTIFDVLKLADLHNASSLRKECLLFLELNKSILSKRPEIASLINRSDVLGTEILKALSL